MNTYLTDLKSCNSAILDFREEIDDLLPDWKGEYYIEWTLQECKYIKKEIDDVANTILSTKMVDHCAYEVTEVSRKYNDALSIAEKTGDFTACKTALLYAVDEFNIIRAVCIKAEKRLEGKLC